MVSRRETLRSEHRLDSLLSREAIFIANNLPFESEIAPLLIVIKLEEHNYAGATAIASKEFPEEGYGRDEAAQALLDAAGRVLGPARCGVCAVVAIVLGVRRHRPVRRGPWYLMAAGVALWTGGDAAWAWLVHVAQAVLQPDARAHPPQHEAGRQKLAFISSTTLASSGMVYTTPVIAL